jgi:hypothetical protein
MFVSRLYSLTPCMDALTPVQYRRPWPDAACAWPMHRRPHHARLLGSPLPVLSTIASRALPLPEERGLTATLCDVYCQQPRDVCRREALP